MNKLDKMFRINPLYESDGYKVGHNAMLAPNTTFLYGTWIPRSLKYMHPSITEIMSAGQQVVVRYLHSSFQENFFDMPISVAKKFTKDMCKYLMMEYNGDHFEALHKLGYLPVRFKALPEGIFTPANIPHMTFVNTVEGFAWLTLYLETMVSKTAWQMPTAATIGNKFKMNAVEWVTKTDKANLWLADYMCHDFHARGGNPFTSIVVGLGHALSNSGSDTLTVIEAGRYYYDVDEEDVCINSVNASEHSVTCTGIFFYEAELRKLRVINNYEERLKKGEFLNSIEEYYSFDVPCEGSVQEPDYLAISEWLNLRDWLKKFPKGILSVVSDTFDLWKLITYILPRLKPEILAREGKLVIRPDSGNPVDIICGDIKGTIYPTNMPNHIEVCRRTGVIELLYDIFGGDVSAEGYIRLDSHIGAIYGDSINLERQVAIYSRLADKGFAATNIVLGIGSYSYVLMTRDNAGYAAKGAWFQVEEEFYASPESLAPGHRSKSFNIYKDPITDDGSKKSLKGLCAVMDDGLGNLFVKTECTPEEETKGLLKIIYEDGKFYNQVSLDQIRARLKQ